ncbi:type I polyketide synthase [Fibrella aquatilis]|uniref:Type I polyketide synthase n=1 Tax=Fibrella aquatilis TaxID=2817059 RepID=A0A939G5K9_9BACT|nr:type I polyketide synthase [Fibrella aquatilis]MBO0931460.1 type I polyketide synthase [Fibrella aquatilis]
MTTNSVVNRPAGEPIAVIGMGCRFPMAPNPEAFWELMASGTDAVVDVPPDRWSWRDYYDPTPGTERKAYSRWGGFLESVDQFDPLFFDISPREAHLMDPQQRLMLEVAWETLENANYTRDKLAQFVTGVFVGCSFNGYFHQIEPALSALDYSAGVGNQNAIIANRISYWLNLKGPSILVDTMCSSSLVAVHMACQSLRTGDCEVALVGGVNVLLSPAYYVQMSRMKVHSATGRCRTFDAGADGIVLGEGAGAVLLKPLRLALRDGDLIHGIIRGTAVNHGGETNGLTAPNPLAQADLITKALDNAGLTADAVTYVEAHGTGTALGDPIEIDGLTKAFRRHTDRTQFCTIGSVKTNIGHLESAAGMAQLIKVLLAVQKRQLPPNLHFTQPNRHIRFEQTPFRVATRLQPWNPAGPRVAGISSFGIGGTNAHVVLEEAPQTSPMPVTTTASRGILTLSARTEAALVALAGRYAAFVLTMPPEHLADVCYTSNTGRTPFEHRLALPADTPAQLAQQLTSYVAEHPGGQVHIPVAEPKIAFLFTGQGAQYAGMGRDFYETYPVFAQTIRQCATILQTRLAVPLTDALFGENADYLLATAAYGQPALFAFEYALARLWQSWGVAPDVVIGHSLGEYVAACVAGVMSLADSLTLVAERGRLMDLLPAGGEMVSVLAEAAVVDSFLASFDNTLCVAVQNGPQHLVVSGFGVEIAELIRRLHGAGIMAKRLTTTHAFHSPLMTPMLPAFREAASRVSYHPPHTPLVANVTGAFAGAEVTHPGYWVGHITAPVQFSEGLQTLLADGSTVLIEIGPQPVLLALAKHHAPDGALHYLPSSRRGGAGQQPILDSLSQLYGLGYSVDWPAFHAHTPRRQQRLPTYTFDRQSYWIAAQHPAASPVNEPDDVPVVHPLLGRRLPAEAGTPGSAVWETTLSPLAHMFLEGHQFMGADVVPFSAYVDMAMAAAWAVHQRRPGQLRDLELSEVLPFARQAPRRVRSVALRLTPNTLSFRVYSLPTSGSAYQDWVLHASVLVDLSVLPTATAHCLRPA